MITIADDRILERLDANEIYLLLWMVKRALDDDTAWPSVKTQMEDTGWSKNTVLKVRRSLEDKGCLDTFHRIRQNNTNASNEYEILVEEIIGGSSMRKMGKKMAEKRKLRDGSKFEPYGSKNELGDGSNFEPPIKEIKKVIKEIKKGKTNEVSPSFNSPSSSSSIDGLNDEKFRQVESRIRAKIKSREILEIIGDRDIDVPTLIELSAKAFCDYDTQGYDDGNKYSQNKMLKYVRKAMATIAAEYSPAADVSEDSTDEGGQVLAMNIYERCDYVLEMYGRIFRKGRTPDKDVYKSEYYQIKKLLETGESLEYIEELFVYLEAEGSEKFAQLDFMMARYDKMKDYYNKSKSEAA